MTSISDFIYGKEDVKSFLLRNLNIVVPAVVGIMIIVVLLIRRKRK